MVLSFFGMSIAFGMRTNMSVAIVAMTSNTTNNYVEAGCYKLKKKNLI